MTVNTNEPTSSTQSQSSANSNVRDALSTSTNNGKKVQRQNISSFNQSVSQGRGLLRHSTSENVLAFSEEFTKIFTVNGQQQFDVAVLDAPLAQVATSALVIYGKVNSGSNGSYIAAYTILLEETTPRLTPRTVQLGGANLEIPRVTIDVFDDFYFGKVTEILRAKEQGEVINAGATVLPIEVSRTDIANLRKIAFYAQEALVVALENLSGGSEAPFCLQNIDTRDTQFPARVDFNSVNVESAAGLPIRSDISLSLVGQVNGNSQQSQVDQSIDIVNINGYVDLTFTPPPINNNPNVPPSLKSYQPRFVITRWDTGSVISPELMLTGLAAATILNEDMLWANTFRPKMTPQGQIDLKDIGAIGLDINLTGNPKNKPAKIDTKAETFQHKSLYELVSATFHEHLMYSLDIEEGADLSWLQSAFLEASNGNSDANLAIIRSADAVTGGHFNEAYKNALAARPGLSDVVCFNEQLRLPTGYYVDADGKRADIRELDLLALLNLGHSSQESTQDWSDIFDNQNLDPVQRTALYLETIDKLISSNFYHKGWAQRVTFNPAFMEALAIASRKAGLQITPANTKHKFNERPTRGNLNAGNYALGNSASGLFRTATTDRSRGGHQGSSLGGGRSWW